MAQGRWLGDGISPTNMKLKMGWTKRLSLFPEHVLGDEIFKQKYEIDARMDKSLSLPIRMDRMKYSFSHQTLS